MNNRMNKESFLKLCGALEEDTITLEQFHVLSNIDYVEEIHDIFKILKMKDLSNKDEIFRIITTVSERPAVKSKFFYSIFDSYPIYKTDIERFRFVMENFYPYHPTFYSFFSIDVFWNNKKLVDLLVKMNCISPLDCGVFNRIISFYQSNPKIFEDECNQEILCKVLQSLDSLEVVPLIRCMEIKSVCKEPMWFDYLILFDKMNGSSIEISYFPAVFQMLEENNRMEDATNVMKTLNDLILEKDEKEEVVVSFFSNLLSLQNEDVLSFIQEPYFDYLLQSSISTSRYMFYDLIDVMCCSKANNVSVEEAIQICNSIRAISAHNVRSTVIEAYFDQIIEIEDFANFVSMDIDGANVYFMRKAFEKNNQKYIEKNREYFGVSFSKQFCDYINNSKLSKEEILHIRDMILDCSISFCEDTFIVDTCHLVPSDFISTDELSVGDNKKEGEPRKKTLKFFQRFRKNNV